nr:glycosyltransferase [Providencia rettgeri]
MNDYKSFLKNKVAQFQRTLLKLALIKINKSFNCKFIVHTEAHKKQLSNFIGKNDFYISVIDYPAPEPISKIEDFQIDLYSPIKLLIFGTIRPDKGLFEFIESVKNSQLDEYIKITIAGKVMDERFRNYIPAKNVEIIDRFLQDFELNTIVSNCHFFLVPYAKNYTGGAGPAKDATSYGKPVIVSNLDIFKEFSQKDFVYIINEPDDLIKIINDLTPIKYKLSCLSSLEYSRNNNWTTLRDRYNAL